VSRPVPARGREVARPLDSSLIEILGPPALLESEDAGAYDAMHDQVREAVAPTDVIEEIWVRDIVDLVWETLRLRRLRAKLIDAARGRALWKLLEDLGVGYTDRNDLVGKWVNRQVGARKEVDKLLKKAGFDADTIVARTLAARIDDVEPIDRMIMQGETRRNAVLREIDRRREAVARRLKDAVAEIEDAEFEDVSHGQEAA
jgi:hypothetical protein